jgi:enoyl-CoA hydratase/carnithine racemase
MPTMSWRMADRLPRHRLAVRGQALSAPGSILPTTRDQDIAALYRNALRLFAAPLPVVAAVQGGAIGGGLRARPLG